MPKTKNERLMQMFSLALNERCDFDEIYKVERSALANSGNEAMKTPSSDPILDAVAALTEHTINAKATKDKAESRNTGKVDTRIKLIPLDHIQSCCGEFRQETSDNTLQEMAETMKIHGVLQPIIVRLRSGSSLPNDLTLHGDLTLPGDLTSGECADVGLADVALAEPLDKKHLDKTQEPIYEIVSGERRWQSAQLCGLTEIPAQVWDVSDNRLLEIRLIENLHRENLNSLEIGYALKELKAQQSCSIRDLAKRIGQTKAWVEDRLSLPSLPNDLQVMVSGRPDTLTHARELKKVDDITYRAKLISLVIDNGSPLSLTDLRDLIKQHNLNKNGHPTKQSPSTEANSLPSAILIQSSLKQSSLMQSRLPTPLPTLTCNKYRSNDGNPTDNSDLTEVDPGSSQLSLDSSKLNVNEQNDYGAWVEILVAEIPLSAANIVIGPSVMTAIDPSAMIGHCLASDSPKSVQQCSVDAQDSDAQDSGDQVKLLDDLLAVQRSLTLFFVPDDSTDRQEYIKCLLATEDAIKAALIRCQTNPVL